MPLRDQDLSEIRRRILARGIPLIGESPAFRALLRSVERIARQAQVAVLIRGETGTGKELIARAIHYLGERREGPFVPVNCGALPEALIENELFGHRSGAFTGAVQEAIGLVRFAHKGTLFLDEVDSLSLKAQVALLRFIEDGRYRPLGGAREEHADVRLIAASNCTLQEEISAGRFREDLYYRLNLLSLDVPPLRVRAGDTQVLSSYFLTECAHRYGASGKSLSVQTVVRLDSYHWPGNVRELENLLHRAYLLSDNDELHIDLPTDSSQPITLETKPCESDAVLLSYRTAKARALQEFDRAYLTRLMRQAGGSVTRAALLAGKERRALGKLLKRYHIDTASTSYRDKGR